MRNKGRGKGGDAVGKGKCLSLNRGVNDSISLDCPTSANCPLKSSELSYEYTDAKTSIEAGLPKETTTTTTTTITTNSDDGGDGGDRDDDKQKRTATAPTANVSETTARQDISANSRRLRQRRRPKIRNQKSFPTAISTTTMTSDDVAQFDDDVMTTTTTAPVRRQAARMSPLGTWATTVTTERCF